MSTGDPEEIRDGTLAGRLFDCLSEQAVRYVHWKSNIHLDSGLLGRTDLDLLVHREDGLRLRCILGDFSFKRLEEGRLNSYPGVEHYLGYDSENRRFCHLHVHFRLIFGKKYLKEYFLPEGYALFLNSQKKSGVNVPGPEFELAIFLLRVCSKINVWSYIQSLLWTGHAVKGFEKEFQYLRTRSQRDRFVVAIETLRLDRFRETLLALYESLDNLTLWTLLAQRKRMSRLRRLSLGERYRMLLERWGVAKFHKLINKEWRNLMVLPERGVSVALIGIDGSGKSTIASELKKRFSWRVSSEVVYFGSKEIDKDLSTIKHVGGIFLGAIRKILALSRFQAGVIDVDLLRSSLNHLLNSFGRARQYRFFKRLLAQGKIALCDRFPFADLGSFADAEAIDSVKEGMKTGLARYIACVFSRIENRNYRYTVFPDLIIYLHADPQIAYRRKMQQPPEILKRKEGILRQSLKRAEIRSHVVRLDSDRTSIDDIVHASIMEIWNRI